MKHTYIVLLDEVNCVIDGLTNGEKRHIHQEMKIYVENYRHAATYKLGAWDGKNSHFSKKGFTYIFLLPKIIPMIEEMGYEWEYLDDRKERCGSLPKISNDYLKDFGIDMRDWQVESINICTQKGQGLVEAATSAGKTVFCGALCKMYNEMFGYKTITIVPSENLVNQTHKQYTDIGLDAGKNHGKILKKKKEENFSKPHVVSTWQSLSNQRDVLDQFDVIIYDEAHIIGDVMFELLSTDLAHAQIRIGLTATIPKTKWKRESLCCHIGGDVLYTVKTKELQEEGHVSTLDITMIPMVHHINLPDNEWETEFAYLNKNRHRIATIIDFINRNAKDNTLILVQAELGNRICKDMEIDFIDKDVDGKIREEYYKRFESENDYKLLATFGTVGTGVSINRIKTLITIDIGKNETRIMQGIGRGLRLDGELNHLNVLDVYADLYREDPATGKLVSYSFSSYEHLKQRKRIYKKEKYPFKQGKEIYVINE